MRHLKTYESFYLDKYPEASTHIQTLEDILIDLEDVGCYVSVSPTPIAMAEGIEPDIYVSVEMDAPGPFTGENIYAADREERLTEIHPSFVDTYKRMVSYMDSSGWAHNVPTQYREYRRREEMYVYKMGIRFFRK